MAENNPKLLDLDAGENEQLEPTEREEHFFKAMIDAADGSTTEELEPTERREHWYSGIINAIQNGGGGSGGGVLVVTDTDGTLDKTWQEIHDAPAAIIKLTSTEPSSAWGFVISVDIGKGYDVYVITGINAQSTFAAQSADGYPVLA